MQKIALPQNIEFKKGEKSNEGAVIISPCYPGYGTTLGSALRRVLLSSLSGSAVVGVKIKGASHEFMSLPKVKEDVLGIILNLKNIRLKVHSDEIVKLELEANGIKEVKAGDIKPNSEVEIMNPDLLLAHITDIAGDLKMEIFVSAGQGYEMAENREGKEKEVNYIEIDSIFSPVLNVSVNVENIRIGKMTNWEKLILNILTDGTMSPEEAFKKSNDILIKQFNALAGVLEEDNTKEENKEKIDSDKEEKGGVKSEEDKEEEKKEKKKPKKRAKKEKE